MTKLLEVCSAIGFMGVGGSLYALARNEANTTFGGTIICVTMCVMLLVEIGSHMQTQGPKDDGSPPVT